MTALAPLAFALSAALSLSAIVATVRGYWGGDEADYRFDLARDWVA